MRLLYIAILVLSVSASCSQQPKHPQADIINKGLPATITEHSIIRFADSINANLGTFEKQSSLVYQRGDSSFYVEKYSANGAPILYKTFSENAGLSNSKREYYFNSDSLILVKESITRTRENGEALEETRIYLRNNIAFKKERRTGLSASSLNQQKFSTIEQTEPASENYTEVLTTLKDAINTSNEFDVVFDKLISSPAGKHIVLKSKMPNGYGASINVRESDPFIDSLSIDPLLFKEQKLRFKWEIKDRDAYYVPVASSTTSANGLNR